MSNSNTNKALKENLIIMGRIITLGNIIVYCYVVMYLIRRNLFMKAVRRELKLGAEGRLRYPSHLLSNQYKRERERYGITHISIPRAWQQMEYWKRQPDYNPR